MRLFINALLVLTLIFFQSARSQIYLWKPDSQEPMPQHIQEIVTFYAAQWPDYFIHLLQINPRTNCLKPERIDQEILEALVYLQYTILTQTKETFIGLSELCNDLRVSVGKSLVGKEKPEKRRRKVSKNHECIECGKLFQVPEHLRRHLRSHTKEKPYECAHCYQKFTRSDNLNTHMKHHNLSGKITR